MFIPPPPWYPEVHPDYNTTFKAACEGAFLALQNGGSAVRRAFLSDPRAVHRELYEPLTPPGYAVYAGTFRGAPDTPLVGREVSSPSSLGQDPYGFLGSANVAASMADLETQIGDVFQANLPPEDFTRAAGIAFFHFGYIHPFLDGNGHIQRLMFAALIFEHGLTLSTRWTIHERPYDQLLAIALELGVRHPASQALAAEYLRLFVNL